MQVRVVVSGRNYHWAEAIPDRLTLADGCSLDAALEALAAAMPEGQRLPQSCLVAVSGLHVGTLGSHRPHVLRDGDELLVLAPVAGG
jgi:molybdopterin converting factor small subunit